MGATYRSDAMNLLPIYASERPPRATRRTSRERHLQSDTDSSLARRRPGSDVFGATQSGRSRRNDPGATSRSDVPRSLRPPEEDISFLENN
ncbi:hypothetical protein YC2023_081457 [Brassica napus]